MPTRDEDLKTWESFWQRAESYEGALSRSKAKNVNTSALRQQAREFVRDSYFREARPALQRLGATDATTQDLDAEMQRLIGLSAGKNSKASHQKLVKNIKARRKTIETGLEFLIGVESPAAATPSGIESAILGTLERMVPTAGASYRQALHDLEQQGRGSYRGTAAELREVVREVLDHLAPDEAVMAASGFKLEEGLKGPSMKQKVRFILKARRVPEAGMRPAEDSVRHLDESIPSLGRSVYNRASMDAHTARSKEEVLNLKLYADAVLGELLEIHKAASPRRS